MTAPKNKHHEAFKKNFGREITLGEQRHYYFAPCPHCLVVDDLSTIPTWGEGLPFSGHACRSCGGMVAHHCPTTPFFAGNI